MDYFVRLAIVSLLVAVVRCQDNTEDCTSTPCQNDGSCISVPGGNSCSCKADFSGQYCEDVVFPSGVTLTSVDEAELSASDASAFQDAIGTGSKLFHIQTNAELRLKLSLTTRVDHYKHPDADYFRTHPLLVKCVQRLGTYARLRESITVVVEEGYVPYSQLDNSSPLYDQYKAAGTGVTLAVRGSTDTEDLMKIVDAAILSCATDLFSSERRYLGLTLTAENVHVFMLGENDEEPQYTVLGNSDYTDNTFATYCKDWLNAVLDPVKRTDCRAFPVLVSSEVHPENSISAESTVGMSDAPSDQDSQLNNLVIYPGSNVGLNGRILVAPRLYDVIRKLQHFIKGHTSNADTLRVMGAYDSGGSGLYQEGRAADVHVASGDNALLDILSYFAICSGADYVSHEGSQLMIAVKKQNTIRAKNARVTFANGANLLSVSPPEDDMTSHLLPGVEDLPIFDSDSRMATVIGDYASVGLFVSNSSRYLRLDPVIAKCYDRLVAYDTKWNNETVSIEVVKGYMSRDEFEADEPTEQEMSHSRGLAMVVRYGGFSLSEFAEDNGIEFTASRLAENAIKMCGALISKAHGQAMGVVVSDDEVYIDVRSELYFQTNDSHLPENSTSEEYTAQIEDLYQNGLDGRLVNPELPVRACQRDVSPKMKSVDFRYEHPAHITARRRRRQSGDEEDHGCTPTRDTDFCTETEPHRIEHMDYMWAQFKRKHFYHDEQELEDAMHGCFGDCGTCLLGEVYEDKTEHCTHLLHWLPFELMNEAEDSTHLYDRRSSTMKRLACVGDNKQCLFNAPLYAMLATSIEALYRPDPTESVEEQLYGATTNPLPVYEILYPMFGVNARGVVTVWVETKQELNNIRAALKAAMLYNKKVTHVDVMVTDAAVLNDVTGALETMIDDWTRTGCTLYSRPAVAPYTMHIAEEEARRRRAIADDGFSFGEDLIQKQLQFEKHWAIKVRN